jgi:hypothetical protein
MLCLLAMLAVASCSTTGPRYTHDLSTDYRLLVRQPMVDIANGTHIEFQQGQLIRPGNLDRWTTYCRLYVYDPELSADDRVTVLPGSVAINEVRAAYHSSEYPLRPFFGYRSWGVRDIPSYYLYQVGMRLSAPDQPGVRSLVCSRKWASPNAHQYPSLEEIRAALGDYLALEAPG